MKESDHGRYYDEDYFDPRSIIDEDYSSKVSSEKQDEKKEDLLDKEDPLDNEDIMRMGIDFYLKDNIEEYLEKIIKVSEFWWEKEDIIRDDITSIVVFF